MSFLKILAIGDVCGSAGCEMLRRHLPSIKRKYGIDFTVVNGENSADGNGISKESAELIFNCGADVITGGNHTLRRPDFHPVLDENERLLRPHNLTKANYGSGYCLVDMGHTQVAVINLSGQIYLEKLEALNPFLSADELIEKAENDGADIIIVDFHAEATSEKRALGLYLDGKVSLVFGTHTHVQTADEQILKNGTAYITDLGMTGPIDSVLGVEPSIIIGRLRDNNMSRFELAKTPCSLEGLVVEIDKNTRKAIFVERINIR